MLFASKKIESIPFRDFMNGTYKQNDLLAKKKKREDILSYSLIGLSVICTVFDPSGGSIALASGLQERIIHAFDPIIDLMQGIAYPVSFLMITCGALLIMTGQKSRGLSMMKYAGLGYIALQLAPALMDILVDIGKEMAGK